MFSLVRFCLLFLLSLLVPSLEPLFSLLVLLFMTTPPAQSFSHGLNYLLTIFSLDSFRCLWLSLPHIYSKTLLNHTWEWEWSCSRFHSLPSRNLKRKINYIVLFHKCSHSRLLSGETRCFTFLRESRSKKREPCLAWQLESSGKGA